MAAYAIMNLGYFEACYGSLTYARVQFLFTVWCYNLMR